MGSSVLKDSFGRPLRDLRISVIDRCNFRCPYCMPKNTYDDDYEFLAPNDYLSFAEIHRLVLLFAAHGVEKIRLTGGEPLLRPRLFRLVELLSEIPSITDIALTTNGFLLAEQAEDLRAAGLQRVTISLDSIDPDIFKEMNGLGIPIDRVITGIRKAQEVGLSPVKLNTVVQRGVNEKSVVDLVRHFVGEDISIRFIEYMDVGNRNEWKPSNVVTSTELKARIEKTYSLKPLSAAYPGEVAKRYSVVGTDTEIGFVSSISQPFCRDCSRARLSADGGFYTCLFAWQGHDLRKLLRSGASDEEISASVAAVWQNRADRYSEERSEIDSYREDSRRKIEMYQIGG